MGCFYALISWFNYLMPLIFIIVLVMIFSRNKKNKKVQEEFKKLYGDSLANQKESIQLLKEIRDSLKK